MRSQVRGDLRALEDTHNAAMTRAQRDTTTLKDKVSCSLLCGHVYANGTGCLLL